MKVALAIAALLALLPPIGAALAAQPAPIPAPVVVTPIPIPPPAAAPNAAPPAATIPTAPPPVAPATGTAAPTATPPPAASAPAAPPEPWVTQNTVSLVVLNKVSAQTAKLSGPVGSTLTTGTLSIIARACVVRPADLPADAAAFLQITDSKQVAAPFAAWILMNEPELSAYENPIYSVYLAGCGK